MIRVMILLSLTYKQKQKQNIHSLLAVEEGSLESGCAQGNKTQKDPSWQSQLLVTSRMLTCSHTALLSESPNMTSVFCFPKNTSHLTDEVPFK